MAEYILNAPNRGALSDRYIAARVEWRCGTLSDAEWRLCFVAYEAADFRLPPHRIVPLVAIGGAMLADRGARI